MRQGITQGIRQGITQGINARSIPRDGPQNVYVPETESQWTALGFPAPTLQSDVSVASGDIPPLIGDVTLTAGGSGHLYEQSVSGWSRKAVGTPGGSTTRWLATHSLAAGESCFVLAYASAVSPSGSQYILSAADEDNALAIRDTDGVLRSRHGGTLLNGSEDHAGLATVRPLLWERNAEDDVSGTSSDIEVVSATHDESAITDGILGIGRTNAFAAQCRILLLAFWTGSDAAALIAAGLANQSAHTRLGWSVSS